MGKIFQSDSRMIFHCIGLISTIAFGQKEMVALKFQILWKKFDVSKDHIFEFQNHKMRNERIMLPIQSQILILAPIFIHKNQK